MTLALLALIGLLAFMAGAWLMRLQKQAKAAQPGPRSLPAPSDWSDVLMRIVAYGFLGGGAITFLGAVIGLAYAILT